MNTRGTAARSFRRWTLAAACLSAIGGLTTSTLAQTTQPASVAVPPTAEPAQARLVSPANDADDLAFANRLSNAFKSVASRAEPAVVHIIGIRNISRVQRDWFGRIISRGQPEAVPSNVGSGFIIDGDGTIVTNNHVVADADDLRVRLADGREFGARLVGRDETTDLAVIRLKLEGKSLNVRPLVMGDSDSLDVGEWVVAIGSPFGFSRTVTAGIVSAKGRSLTPRETGRAFEDFIQTDAAINPGNSGGPLLNLRGEVVGINSAIATRTGGYEGLGFAIPSNLASLVKTNILQNGRVVRGWLGVDLQDATADDLGAYSGVSDPYRGVVVKSVNEDSPAERAGLKDGDVVLRFRGQPVNEARLRTAIGVAAPGTKVPIDVLRDGKVLNVTVTVGDAGDEARAQGALFSPEAGMALKPFTKDMARRAGYRPFRGVQVVSVEPDSPAQRSQLQPGDIIVRAGGAEVASCKELADAIAAADLSHGVRLELVRGNQMGYLDLQK